MAGALVLRPNARVEVSSDSHFLGFRQKHEVEIRLHVRIDGDAAQTRNGHRW